MNRKEQLTKELENVRRALVFLHGSSGDRLYREVIDEMIRQENRDKPTYHCAICKKPITKAEYEIDISACKECMQWVDRMQEEHDIDTEINAERTAK